MSRDPERQPSPPGPSDRDDPPPPILEETEEASRKLLLAKLQVALAEAGVDSVLAGSRRLVLRYNQAPLAPSGPTDPRLYIFLPGHTRTATTDGTTYRLDNAQELPVSDPAAVAVLISTAVPAMSTA